MGPTYIPDRGNPEDLGDDAPVFRSGTFLTHRFFSGGGVTIGRNLVINKLKGSGSVIDDYNDFLEDHEFGHYLDILKLGFGKFYDKNALEYIKYGFKGSYSVPGTNEFSADVYSYFQNGYYFDESPLSHQLYRPPGTTNGYKTY